MQKNGDMPNAGLMMTFEARPGKEIELEDFLENGFKNAVMTTKPMIMRVGDSGYAIIDTAGSDHRELISQAGHLFVTHPKIEKVELLDPENN